eukprot:CAMPEP_0185020772 /NCGR_PEP_ID=MMETSP1103-20130426/3420_1 /TAXON_ID=36769 /ORGANISM="Paraphysomonas bandaiensis, Strain Caron Lab Isolate" /LENGTH=789 /DNA_ID=CAMNT_0027551885 /DNA_START=30 /DNA_END=2396 /DNA_ORIENTATION=-
MMGMSPLSGIRVTLISRDVDTPYSGMLPGYVAGHYTREECHLDLRQICSFASIRFIGAEVCGIDPIRKRITFTGERPPLSYDIISINIGITPTIDPTGWTSLPDSNITPVKPIDGFARRWMHIVNRARESAGKILRVVVVGGGAGGCELCLAMHKRFTDEFSDVGRDISELELTLVNRGPDIMASHNRNVRQIVKRILEEKGVKVLTGVEVTKTSVNESKSCSVLLCRDGSEIVYDEVIWCTQAAPQKWLRNTGLSLDSEGFICVKTTMESTNMPDVFAAGDVCTIVGHPRPKAGVFAVRAGPPLVANLRRRLLNESPLEEYIPQEQFLGIIGTGDPYAIASRGPLALEGEYLWTLKDHIDRTWMGNYTALKKMDMSSKSSSETNAPTDESIAEAIGQEAIDLLLHSKMRCGGCGSKVGAQVLDRALKRIKKLVPSRSEVVAGLGVTQGDDAALVRPPVSTPGKQMLLVHTIDYFRSFISDPYVFGRVAAIHALSDLHAMNADPVSALALCVLPYGPEPKVEDNLVQMLAGMCSMLQEENCALIGGHTSEGTDAALGLSVNGTVVEGGELRKGPPMHGDVLILTKRVGTGALMAADMRALAKGRWVEKALESMQISNRKAAQILQEHGCSGCTDVTGFGVMGHLLEMMKHNKLSSLSTEEDDDGDVCHLPNGATSEDEALMVTLHLPDVPVLEGAKECVEIGVMSSLQPQNVRCARAVTNANIARGNPVYPLLFDPQTSGGLLASISADKAEAVVRSLKGAGYNATSVIGTFTKCQGLSPAVELCTTSL